MYNLISSKLDGLYYMRKTPSMEFAVQMVLHVEPGQQDFMFDPPSTWEPVCVSS